MDLETLKNVATKEFKAKDGILQAKLQVRGVNDDRGEATLQLVGTSPDSVTLTLHDHVLAKVAPAFGEYLVVEIRRPTEAEKEAEMLRGAVDHMAELMRVKDSMGAARTIKNRGLTPHVEIIKSALRAMNPGAHIDGFFERVQDALEALK
jgi:hypothetical protein